MSENADGLFSGAANINWGKGEAVRQWLSTPQQPKWRGGTLLETPGGKVQRRNFDDGKPAFWDDGNAKMQIILTMQTNERDGGDFDDGIRRLYVPCDSSKPGTMYGEICSALRRGGGGMRVGAQVYVALVGLEPSQKKGGEDRRVWIAHFIPAPADTADGVFTAPEGGAAGNGAAVPQQAPQPPVQGYPQNGQPQQVTAAPAAQYQQQPMNDYQPQQAAQQPPVNEPPRWGGGQPAAQPQITGYDPKTGQPIYAQQPAAQPPVQQPQNGYQPQQAPQQVAPPQQTPPQITGYDPATGQPIYAQQAAAPLAHNPYASGPPAQQPQYQAANPYQQ